MLLPQLARIVLPLALVSCATTPNRAAGLKASAARAKDTYTVNIGDDSRLCGEVIIGSREMRSDDLDRVDQQLVLGCRASVTDEDSGIGFEIGFQGSGESEDKDAEDDDGVYGSTLDEFYLGLFAMIGGARAGVHPYIGVGLSYVETETDIFTGIDGVSDDVIVMGAYTNFGIALIGNEGFRLSLDWRSMRGAEMSSGADADYDQLSLALGVSF
jgi:opacity protein-like surface antigen